MRSSKLSVGLLLIFCVSMMYAKTPAQLKTDLATVFGPQKAAYIVFQDQVEGTSNKLKKVSSLEGTISDFLKNPPAGSFMTYPTFTLDGTRVIFWNTQSPSVYIANWSDGVWRKVISGYEGYSSFKNAAGKDMILCKKTGARTLHLVDADNSSDITTAYSGSLNPEYYSISGDGLYIAAIWQGFGSIGIYQVGGSAAVKYLGCPRTAGKICEGGCWCTISRDNQHRVMWTIEPHAGCVIANPDGSLVRDVACFPWIPTPGTSGDVDKDNPNQYNGLRGSNDQDFASVYQEASAVASLPLSRQPYIINLATLKYTYLIDDAPNTQGISGMHVYPIQTGIKPASTPLASTTGISAKKGRIYDLYGRTISDRTVNGAGIYFSTISSSPIRLQASTRP